MNKDKEKQLKRTTRTKRIRARVSGTAGRPRLNVFRSNQSLFLQLIDDEKGKTLASASIKEIKAKKGDGKINASFELGKLIAKKAVDAGIKKIVFDRGGYKYHGRVKAAADGAREGGLEF
jgi:large subunit ribosomal protein L18